MALTDEQLQAIRKQLSQTEIVPIGPFNTSGNRLNRELAETGRMLLAEVERLRAEVARGKQLLASARKHEQEYADRAHEEIHRLRAEVARLSRPSFEVCDMRDARRNNPDIVPKTWGWSAEKRVMLAHGWADTEAEARAAAEKACQP